MKADTACRKLVDEFKGRQTVRAGSLITTVFGDALAPRGGTIWLGSLIQLMSNFGISERLVRTSVFRLAKDGWLKSTQHGRRSYYSLTDEGRERFDVATHRIYSTPSDEWNGQWCLLLLSGLDAVERELARREFTWLGFGTVSTDVMAHPSPDATDLEVTSRRLGINDSLVVMQSKAAGSHRAVQALADSAWNLGDIAERYTRFTAMFRGAARALKSSSDISPQNAFQLRILLIQEYRKVMLRDPQLPADLLPADWPGHGAYELTRTIYSQVHAAADEYLGEIAETADGSLPGHRAGFRKRFGGLAL